MTIKMLSFAVCLGLLAGCSNSPTAPTNDSITLQSIVPAAGTLLVAGERVTFTAVVTATIATADGGLTGFVLQDQRNLSLLDGDARWPEQVLQKGTKTVTFSQTITIPASGMMVNAIFPIFVNGSDTTQAMARQSYTVR